LPWYRLYRILAARKIPESLMTNFAFIRLNRTAAAASLILGSLIPPIAHAAGPDIPESFDVVSAASPQLEEFLQRCMPTATATDVRNTTLTAGDKSIATRRINSDLTKPYLVMSQGSVYCMKASEHRFPILPLSAFDATISFAGMSPDDAKRFYTDLAQQIALRGFALARVTNETGNAVDVVYLVNADSPIKLYYRGTLIKKDDLPQAPAVADVYNATGGMTTTARGQPPENVKFLFSK
jgi:hypothetical protein